MSHVLIAADIGNANVKYRDSAGRFRSEPALVRFATRGGYAFEGERPVRPLEYLSGSAGLSSAAYLVGADGLKGAGDIAAIGSAKMRVQSDAYLLLHFYSILASLGPAVHRQSVAFAGGLPVEDAADPNVQEALKARLKGTHTLRWGEEVYEITIALTLLVPQPIGGIATLMFDGDGRVAGSEALQRKRFVLDIGGGTTDYTGREGLRLLPGTEGGVRLGIQNAAGAACQLLQHQHRDLSSLTPREVLEQMTRPSPTIYVRGEPIDISQEIATGCRQVAGEIVEHVLPQWERQLPQGEVVVFGGGGATLFPFIERQIGSITKVTLLEQPLFRVLDGIERLAKRQLVSKGEAQ